MARDSSAGALKAHLRAIGASKAATRAADAEAWLRLPISERIRLLARHCAAVRALSQADDQVDDEHETWERVRERLRRVS